ncbi:tail tubular protein [Microcystis phage Mae-Yong1326-1]|nr:tail tubular protein [Microcystis phage Mae-Yong1326-1]
MSTPMSLTDMVRALRAESGRSLSTALGTAEFDSLVYTLQRAQQQLYDDNDWPFLLVDRDVALVQGTRFYNYPVDMNFNYVTDIYAQEGSSWFRLSYGIDPADHLSILNSDAGVVGYPPTNWKHNADTGQFEVWPIPAQPGTVRLRGQKSLGALATGSDMSTLDGYLVVLFAAAELLARQKAEDAAYKLDMARKRLRSIQARQGSNKLREPFIMGGGVRPARRPRVGIDYIPQGFTNGP